MFQYEDKCVLQRQIILFLNKYTLKTHPWACLLSSNFHTLVLILFSSKGAKRHWDLQNSQNSEHYLLSHFMLSPRIVSLANLPEVVGLVTSHGLLPCRDSYHDYPPHVTPHLNSPVLGRWVCLRETKESQAPCSVPPFAPASTQS